MAQFYKVLKADPLGTPYDAHGKSIQTYWCQFEGVEKAVSMGKQVPNTPQLGAHVYGDLMYAKSQKGTEYWKFKGSKVPDGVERPADSPAQATAKAATGASGFADQWADQNGAIPQWAQTMFNMIEYIYQEFQKMNGDAATELKESEDKPETLGNEPLDAETKAKIDDIFGDDAPEVE